jgi:hypothetical protein
MFQQVIFCYTFCALNLGLHSPLKPTAEGGGSELWVFVCFAVFVLFLFTQHLFSFLTCLQLYFVIFVYMAKLAE